MPFPSILFMRLSWQQRRLYYQQTSHTFFIPDDKFKLNISNDIFEHLKFDASYSLSSEYINKFSQFLKPNERIFVLALCLRNTSSLRNFCVFTYASFFSSANFFNSESFNTNILLHHAS